MFISKTIFQKRIYFIPKKNTSQNRRYFIYLALALMIMPLLIIVREPSIGINFFLVMYGGILFVLGLIIYFVKFELDNRTLFIGEKGIVLTTYISEMGSYREIKSATFEVKWDELVSIKLAKKEHELLFRGNFVLDQVLLKTKQSIHKINTGHWQFEDIQKDMLEELGILLKPQFDNRQLIIELIKHYKPSVIAT